MKFEEKMTVQLAKLRTFARASEGEPPPIFVGRKDILVDIEEVAKEAWQGNHATAHGISKSTRIVQGAPGAGKSSLIAELVSRSVKNGDTERAPRVLVLPSEMIRADASIALAALQVMIEMPQSNWKRLAKKAFDRVRISAGLAGLTLELTQQGQAKTQTPSNLFDLAKNQCKNSWRFPIIVAVDEAQSLRGGEDTAYARFIQSIHSASSGLPLTLVLAGLGDTADRAREMDLTRGLQIHDIGCLTKPEVSLFLLSTCEYFGIDVRGYERQLERLVHACDGWPRHLHFAIQALATEVLKRGAGEGLWRVDWSHIEKEAKASRTRYYQQQRSSEMKISSVLVAAIMDELPIDNGLKESTVTIAAIMRSIQSKVCDQVGWQLPKGMDATDFVAHLVHNGALHQKANGTFTCPIPSFRNYLIKTGYRDA